MNDYIARLREKYDDHFGCAPSIVLDCRDFWRHCVTAPEMAVFGYRLESSRRPHHVVITAGMSQARMHFAPYMGSARWSSELICYLDVLGGEDLRHLQWLAGLPFHERLALGH
ncbi:suppressor of fused domain protein, partial [Pseudomonas aeruginosa]|nr:suppressor of fused domain protein [Pseudomonas aeruginosa]